MAWIGQSRYSLGGYYTGGVYASLSQNYHAYALHGWTRTFVQIADDGPSNVYMKTGYDHRGGTNVVYREYRTADEPWLHFEVNGAVSANPYEYFAVLYDRYGLNPRGNATTQYRGITWGTGRSLYPGVPRLTQALGETVTDADQMAGDTVNPFSFVDVRRYNVADNQSFGSWVALDGSSVNSRPALHGQERIDGARFDIWDYRCP